MLFSQTKTLELKGIAILMMLYLHLFNTEYKTSLCDWNFQILPDISFLRMLTRLTNPVPFFIMLSGYGLFYKFTNGNRNYDLKKILKLLINYWVILLLFVGLGSYFNPEVYPGTFTTFALNFFTVSSSYNGEWWFLFPYIVLALLAPIIFRCIEVSLKRVFFVSFILSLNRFFIDVCIDSVCLELLKKVLSLQFPFICGAVLYKLCIHDKSRRIIVIPLFVMICCIRLVTDIGSSLGNLLYAFLFIVIYVNVKVPVFLSRLLILLGSYSTSMWLVHSFFIFYLFGPVIYQLRNPLVIFVVLVGISLMVSFLLNTILNKLYIKLKL
jgi:hypothetical protein